MDQNRGIQQTTVRQETTTVDQRAAAPVGGVALQQNIAAGQTTVERQFVKDALITERTNETVREAPIVHEKHVYHAQPVLQEKHIVKEVPVIEKTIIHEQPSLTQREIIHEQPVLIKQQQVVQEQMPVQHEVQHVQHELRTVQDQATFQQAPHLHQQQQMTTQTTTVQKTADINQSNLALNKNIDASASIPKQDTIHAGKVDATKAQLHQAPAASQLQGGTVLQSHGLQSTLDASRTGKPL